ncbi:MAG: hypothetical protein WB992_04620 [Bryobacteraceae bacterium]
MAKVIAAFIAGVVIALGSALIYVRATEAVHVEPAVQTIPPAPEAADTQTPAPVPAQDAAAQDASHQAVPNPPPAPVERVHPKSNKAVRTRVPVSAPRLRSRPQQPSSSVVQIAQNSPAPLPPVDSQVPAPNIKSQAPAPQPQPEPQPEIPAPAPDVAPPPEASRQPHVVTLQPGTNLTIRLGETLSTEHNYTGDTFRASLESPVILDGFIIADKGSKVLGRIVNVQRAGRVNGVADLNLTLAEINTTDGQRVRIDTSSYDKRGPVSTGEDAAKIAGGAALGAIIGGIAGGGKGAAIGAGVGGGAGTGTVLATRGKSAVLPAETRLTFRLAAPVTITERLSY